MFTVCSLICLPQMFEHDIGVSYHSSASWFTENTHDKITQTIRIPKFTKVKYFPVYIDIYLASRTKSIVNPCTNMWGGGDFYENERCCDTSTLKDC